MPVHSEPWHAVQGLLEALHSQRASFQPHWCETFFAFEAPKRAVGFAASDADWSDL